MTALSRRAWVVIILSTLLPGLGGAAIWVSHKWPFTRASFTRTLEEESGGGVTMGQFTETFFPPGCVARGVRVANKQDLSHPLIEARILAVQATWHGLLFGHIQRISVDGLHVLIPPSETSAAFLNPSTSKTDLAGIGEVDIKDGLIEFLPHSGQNVPNLVKVNHLVLDHLARDKQASFRASFITEKPPGEILCQGRAGPLNAAHPGLTPISGTYRLANADLKVFDGLTGTLSSQGKLSGILSKIETEGSFDVPQFHVDGSAHSERLTGTFRGNVDSHSADTILEYTEAHVGRTTVVGTGNISGGRVTEGKTARLRLAIDSGRVEDVLNYFSDERYPSMTGSVRLKADVELPPGPGFLKKVIVTGDFGVNAGKFTNPELQKPVNRLGASAVGAKAQIEDARTVVTNLKGHVAIRQGVATLTNISFQFPGNYATLNGTCQLIPMTIDMHGTLRTDGKLSDSSTGFKSLMLKVATPFLKKKSNFTIVPIAITGPASHPSIKLDLLNKTHL